MNSFNQDSTGYWIEKDPDAILDYPMDWSSWLETGETLVTSSWLVDNGLTKDSENNTTTASVVWLSGGVAGQTYLVTNRITTSLGRQEDRSFRIKVQNR